jgi:hypothetical protein
VSATDIACLSLGLSLASIAGNIIITFLLFSVNRGNSYPRR